MKRYIFDPEVIDECAMACLGHRKPEMFDVFARAVEERYPGRIDNSQPWIYSIAGGAMIQMKLYFASLHEYVMISSEKVLLFPSGASRAVSPPTKTEESVILSP